MKKNVDLSHLGSRAITHTPICNCTIFYIFVSLYPGFFPGHSGTEIVINENIFFSFLLLQKAYCKINVLKFSFYVKIILFPHFFPNAAKELIQ